MVVMSASIEPNASADAVGFIWAMNGQAVSATPAYVGGRIYVRGRKNLWCLK